MSTKLLMVIALFITLSMFATTNADEKDKAEKNVAPHHYLHKEEKPHAAEWGYRGDIGPANWWRLSNAYILAKDGKRQSPIDISMPRSSQLKSIDFRYQPLQIKIVYNGHTIEDIQDERSFILVDGKEYHLKQFHFHSPSEHTINGKHSAMEMHSVHQTEAGQIAVVAVMIEEGKEQNEAYRPVWSHLPTELNKTKEFKDLVDTAKMLPKRKTYFRYSGSFTTPPCTEDVVWMVLSQPVKLSGRQIMEFRKIIRGNNRLPQPRNGRIVLRQSN